MVNLHYIIFPMFCFFWPANVFRKFWSKKNVFRKLIAVERQIKLSLIYIFKKWKRPRIYLFYFIYYKIRRTITKSYAQ